jgi:quaternary ammonium compound-resistance protein SugE
MVVLNERNESAFDASRMGREGNRMSWLYLVIAGVFEIAWAIGLKYTEGFTRVWPSTGTLMAMIASLYFLAQALKTIPVGTGYAVWTGIGAAGTAILGIVLFAESTALLRLVSLVLIVAGIVGLKVSN